MKSTEALIREARSDDLSSVTTVEAICFLPEEAASKERMRSRLAVWPNHFWVLEVSGKIVGFINGMMTQNPVIEDVMFEKADMHLEDGAWQSVFGLAVLPEYRCQGFATQLMEHLIAKAHLQGRQGYTLTCKEKLIPFYSRFGYENQGLSKSEHGGAQWYDMVLTF